jgi:hypothetical protein
MSDRAISALYTQDNANMRPALEGLLLGLHFRDWLTESDQRFLVQLVPAPGRILLSLEGRQLFPDNTEELGAEDFASPVLHQSDAVFTYRGRTGGSDSAPCVIHTARIGTIRNRELIIGIAQPDHHWGSSTHVPSIEPTMAAWRAALKGAAESFSELSAHLSPSEPYLIVNRASGRVIAVRDQLCQLLGSEVRTVVDAEYSTVAGRLRKLMGTRGLHLNNVSTGEAHLAVVTLLPERRTTDRVSEDSFFSEFFIHGMRNKLAVIATASSQLECLFGEEGASDRRKLAGIIVSETAELERLIDGLDLLVGNGQRHDRSVSVIDEINGAVRLVRTRLNRPITVVDSELSDTTTVTAPGLMLTSLAEAVLRSHLGSGPGASSRIKIHDEKDSVVLDVATLAEGEQGTRFHPQWQTYASRLSDKLGFACTHQTHDNGNLTTTISIPVEGKPIHVR